MKTLVAGLGNPVFHDDGVGIRIARILTNHVNHPDINIIETAADGLDFLDLFAGYDKAIIIDAIQSDHGEPGAVIRFSPEIVHESQSIDTLHGVGIFSVIELGKRLGLPLPRETVIFGIEVGDINIPDGKFTPEIEDAINVCLKHVLHELNLSQKEYHDEQTCSCYG